MIDSSFSDRGFPGSGASSPRPTIAVTGVAGFIGSHTAEALIERGCTVVGIDNFSSGLEENLAHLPGDARFQLYQGDVRDERAMVQLLRRHRPQCVIHLAAKASVREGRLGPVEGRSHNLDAALAVQVASAAAGIRRFVFASSAAVYGDTTTYPIGEDCPKAPLSAYGEAKLAVEERLLRPEGAFPSALCLRYFNVFGPRQPPHSPYSGVISRFVDCCLRTQAPVLFGDGLQSRDFVSVRSVARANATAALGWGIASGAYNIASGRESTLLEVLSRLRAICPRLPAPTFAPARTEDIRRSVADPSKWRLATGQRLAGLDGRALAALLAEARAGTASISPVPER